MSIKKGEEFPDGFAKLRSSFALLEGRPFALPLPPLENEICRVATEK
jgi:hypothetical protein